MMNSCYSVKVDIDPRSLDRGLTTVVQTTEQHLDSDFNRNRIFRNDPVCFTLMTYYSIFRLSLDRYM